MEIETKASDGGSLLTKFRFTSNILGSVRVDKELESESGLFTLRLGCSYLRFLRWTLVVSRHKESLVTNQVGDSELAEHTGEFEDILGEVVGVLKKSQDSTANSTRAGTFVTNADLPSPARACHTQILRRAERVYGSSINMRPTHLVLKSYDYLEETLRALREAMDSFDEIISASKPMLLPLCEDDVKSFVGNADLKLLQVAAAQEDALLAQIIDQILNKQNNDVTHNTWNNSDGTRVLNQAGKQNFYGGQSFAL